MAWNPKQYFTRDEYRKQIQIIARETMSGSRTPAINGEIYLPHWWIRNEIRVFWEVVIPWKIVSLIIKAVDERIRKSIGLQFRFMLCGDHSSAFKQVNQATVRGQINEQRLFALSLSEIWRDSRCGGRQHADIYILTKPFLKDVVSWGAACFKHGTMIFALHGRRCQNNEFLYRVALHETTHLLGMYCHCDDYQNVEGYSYMPKCNMHNSCPSPVLCPKCTEFIRHWWAQVLYEYEHGQDN